VRIDESTIQQIKSIASLTDVIGDYVSLKKKGANFWACCPFHGEKTPSFSISPSKGIYKCFGCGKSGDSIRFIMDIEGINYGEALRQLAKKYGIDIKEEEFSDEQLIRQNERESLLILLEHAKNFFVNQLKNTDEGKSIGLSYLKERGFSQSTIDAFDLGYSPEAWDALKIEIESKGFNEKIIEESGLLTQKNEKGNQFDRFRARVIFPIHNVSGKVIAFGGRILKSDGKAAKYLNSPESDVYHKSKIVYGISQAKSSIRTEDKCYLVEGYTDVISLHQGGIHNVVASSGTSLTQDQIRLIARFTNNIYVLYDGDMAGIKAALRGMELILAEGLSVHLVVFPDGDDPDSFIRKVGEEKFNEFVNTNAKDFLSFQADLLMKEAGKDPFKISEVIKEMVQSISVIPDAIQREIFVKKTAGLVGISEDVLLGELNKKTLNNYKKTVKDQSLEDIKIPENQKSGLQEKPLIDSNSNLYYQELECIRLVVCFGNMEISPVAEPGRTVLDHIQDELEDFTFENSLFQKVWEFGLARKNANQDYSLKTYLHESNPEIQELSINLSAEKYQLSPVWKDKHEIFTPEETQLLEDLVFKNSLRLKKTKIDLEIEEILVNLKNETNEKTLQEYMERFVDLKEIQTNVSKILGRVIENR
jgi:DNA primase